MISCCGEMCVYQRHEDISGSPLLECLLCGAAFLNVTRSVHSRQGSITEVDE